MKNKGGEKKKDITVSATLFDFQNDFLEACGDVNSTAISGDDAKDMQSEQRL